MFWWHLPLPHSSYFQEIHIDPEKILKQLFGSTKGSKHTELLSRQLGRQWPGCSSLSTVWRQHRLAHRHLKLDMGPSARTELSALLHTPVSYSWWSLLSCFQSVFACVISFDDPYSLWGKWVIWDKYPLYSVDEKAEAKCDLPQRPPQLLGAPGSWTQACLDHWHVIKTGFWNKSLTQTQIDKIYLFIVELNQVLNLKRKLQFYVLSNLVY